MVNVPDCDSGGLGSTPTLTPNKRFLIEMSILSIILECDGVDDMKKFMDDMWPNIPYEWKQIQ